MTTMNRKSIDGTAVDVCHQAGYAYVLHAKNRAETEPTEPDQ